jgi:hypothetical protein
MIEPPSVSLGGQLTLDCFRSTGGTINTSTTQRIIDDVAVLEAERKQSSVS